MTDRRAFLRAILAHPDDDTPRLIYADWLDEFGTTDADAARAEYIRLACGKGLPLAVSPRERRWLRANWPRLVPTAFALVSRPDRMSVLQQGRTVEFAATWLVRGRTQLSPLALDFSRGFVARIRYEDGRGYARFGPALAADEPLAAHGPRDRSAAHHARWDSEPYYVRPGEWGVEVFDRVAGFDRFDFTVEKAFMPRSEPDPAGPADLPGRRARQAVADAMTALARERNGLAPPGTGG